MTQVIALDRSIYREEAVKAGIAAFSELATVAMRETAEVWQVTIESVTGENSRTVARHFLTYVLAASLEER